MPKKEWVSNLQDQQQYKLTHSEQMQKKISLMSKHKLEAASSWKNIQEKLKNNIIDEDTQKVYETALKSKGINLEKSNRRNLTQMIEWEKNQSSQMDILEQAKQLLQKNDSQFIDKVKNDVKSTKEFMDKTKKKKPEQIIKLHEQSQICKENIPSQIRESKMQSTKNSAKKSKIQGNDFASLKNLDNVISFLENTLHNQPTEEPIIERPKENISKQTTGNPLQNIALSDYKMQEYPPIEQQVFHNQTRSISTISNFDNHMKTTNESRIERTLFIDPEPPAINFGGLPIIQFEEEVSFDDNIDQLRLLLEQTRQELNMMNLKDTSVVQELILEEPIPIQIPMVNMREINKKYRNTDSFNIHDHI